MEMNLGRRNSDTHSETGAGIHGEISTNIVKHYGVMWAELGKLPPYHRQRLHLKGQSRKDGHPIQKLRKFNKAPTNK